MLKVRPNFHEYRGHCSHVTNCVWTSDDAYCITSGGADLCIFIWKVIYGETKKPEFFLNANLLQQNNEAQKAALQKKRKSIHGQLGDEEKPQNLKCCHMCSFEFEDPKMVECPRCFAPRRFGAAKARKAWISKAEARFRLPTSSFAKYAREQIAQRKKLQEKEKPDSLWIPVGGVKMRVEPDGASNSDDEIISRKLREKKKTSVASVQPKPTQSSVPKKKKTAGPDFVDY